MRSEHVTIILSFILLFFASCTESVELNLEVEPSSSITKEVPVNVEVTLPSKLQNVPAEELLVTLNSVDGKYKNIPGQIVNNEGKNQLWWILPETNTDGVTQWTATVKQGNKLQEGTFEWKDTPEKYLDLFIDGKQVFRYEYELDGHFVLGETLTAKNKPFYHIYDLAGENKITNGPEEGVWSHHRGIMIGWRNIGFDGEDLSFWGMEDLTVQKHIEFKRNIAGPVLAQTEALIQWNDSNGNTVVEETRKATIFRQDAPDIMLLDYASDLKAVNGPITLDGNADHGGVQFRAHNDVAEDVEGSEKAHYVFHQDSIDAHEDFNLPWVAMSYGLNNKKYSVVQMDNPENPQPNMWSAYRDYGRFGPFFQKELAADETLSINYRFWMSESEMPDREVLSSKYTNYIEPIEVQVVSK